VAVPGTQNVDHNELWASDRVPIAEAEFRDAILHFGLGKAFKPYLQWADRYAFGKSNKLAAVPGDFALTVAGTNCRVGLVGLNSTWVRPSSDDRPAALHSWQLKAVCQPDLDTWTRKHDFCLLVSYYSPAWLGQIWRSSYRAEIAPPGRFALHLCGLPDDAKTLPRVQWVVSTHSPLILSCFDSAEIVALDRSEPGGIRFLDRQILGFSTDEIYQLLLDDSGRAHDAAQRRRTRIIQIEYRPKRM
jgi:hypothetical protein